MPEEKKSYVILRFDGLVLHTKPITEGEARWLFLKAYSARFIGREARVRYLEEHGNVMDASEYVERLRQLGLGFYYTLGIYRDPEELVKDVSILLGDPQLPPGGRQALEEFLGRIEEFLARPVEPRPITAPVRYLELPHPHVRLGKDGAVQEADPKPEWHVHEDACCGELYYGISVFRDVVWLWFQSSLYAYAVAVRRDAPDRDVVAAVANDRAVWEFIRESADSFRQLIREREADLIGRGYDDVVRKVKVMLTTFELLNAGRRGEKALPA